jgi:hypothetical protein
MEGEKTRKRKKRKERKTKGRNGCKQRWEGAASAKNFFD